MINDTSLDKKISEKLLEQEKIKASEHKSTGKLSASLLGWPLQWQVLHYYKVPQPGFDEYTLRKFLRGNQVEDWIISQLDNVVDKQKFVEYKGAIGYLDFTLKHGKDIPFLNNLIIPHEIKSVTNMDFRRILKTKEAKPQHHLQAGFYALATGSDWYAVDYVASDDLRLETYIYETKKMKNEIDKIIEEYNKAIETKKIPLFTARYSWQENPMYSNYPDWQKLTEAELQKKFEKFLEEGGVN